jgi:hypothetical protein
MSNIFVKMKARCPLFLLILMCYTHIQAQQPCGVYSTVSDYKKQNISIPADSRYGKHAVKVSDFFLRPYVYIRTVSGTKKISIDSVFAVRCSNGNLFRVCNKTAYTIVDTSYIKIYSETHLGHVKCCPVRGICLRNKLITNYFFSVNDSSQIIPLTLLNLRYALKVSNDLDRKLSSTFPNDKSLQSKKTNSFMINDFLKSNNI